MRQISLLICELLTHEMCKIFSLGNIHITPFHELKICYRESSIYHMPHLEIDFLQQWFKETFIRTIKYTTLILHTRIFCQYGRLLIVLIL